MGRGFTQIITISYQIDDFVYIMPPIKMYTLFLSASSKFKNYSDIVCILWMIKKLPLKMQQQKDISYFRDALRQQLPLLEAHYHVESLGLFGSYGRQEQHRESDLDVLVKFRETPSLLKFIELENYLSDLLEIKVDLVMLDALKPRLGQHILEEVVPV